MSLASVWKNRAITIAKPRSEFAVIHWLIYEWEEGYSLYHTSSDFQPACEIAKAAPRSHIVRFHSWDRASLYNMNCPACVKLESHRTQA